MMIIGILAVLTILFQVSLIREMYPVHVSAASKDKKHGHSGVLEPYDGKKLPIRLNPAQQKKLDNGEAVVYNERDGRSGRGVVVQDINASTTICMQKIRDLESYPKVVPNLKKVQIYETKKFSNGTTKTAARFDIGLLGIKVAYFLLCTFEPKYDTFTWTLDYRYNSDFDDNVGHWQVQPHPTKRGWTRVLYSTKLKLFGWVPEFIISFLTGKALTESTGWVKRESEAEAKRQAASGLTKQGNAASPWSSWMDFKGGESPCLQHLQDSLECAKKAIQEAESSFLSRRQKLLASWKLPRGFKFGHFKT